MNKNRSIAEILVNNQLDTDSPNWLERIKNTTTAEVQSQLNCLPGLFNLDRLAALISPAAADFLEQMAQQAKMLTTQRFGKTISLYAPLYVSNFCINNCSYCGCSTQSTQNRIRLDINRAVAEADILAAQNIRHILLVSGEDHDFITIDYLCLLAQQLKNKFSSISIEVYPMRTTDYQKLFAAGIDITDAVAERNRAIVPPHQTTHAAFSASFTDTIAVRDISTLMDSHQPTDIPVSRNASC